MDIDIDIDIYVISIGCKHSYTLVQGAVKISPRCSWKCHRLTVAKMTPTSSDMAENRRPYLENGWNNRMWKIVALCEIVWKWCSKCKSKNMKSNLIICKKICKDIQKIYKIHLPCLVFVAFPSVPCIARLKPHRRPETEIQKSGGWASSFKSPSSMILAGVYIETLGIPRESFTIWLWLT